MSTPFKMKGFSGFGNTPVKYEKDAKEFSKRKAKKNKPTVKTEKQAFKEMSNKEKLEYYKSKKAKPTISGKKSIKSSDLTKEQMQNIFPR